MGGKDKFIHIRATDALHAALEASATRAHRPKADQARYLLCKVLGIDLDEDIKIEKKIQEIKHEEEHKSKPARHPKTA